MSETARNDATYEPAAAAETPKVLQQAWWLTLGLLTTIGEGTTKAAETLIEKGRAVDPKVAEPVKRAASEVSGAARDAGERVKRAAADFAKRGRSATPARPTAEEFEQLREEVRELRARVMAGGVEAPDA
jgi:polyhydroxyalkanoate synthesis regulator phasin